MGALDRGIGVLTDPGAPVSSPRGRTSSSGGRRPQSSSTKDGAAGSAPLSADIPFTFAVGMVALIPRLFVAIAWSREPVWDGHYYHFGAMRIAQGLGYSEDALVAGARIWRPWCHYPVGYSGMLAAAYKVFGSGPLVAPALNAVIGALLAVVVHRLALRALTVNRARIAAGVVALDPGLIVYSAVLMSEVVSAFFILLGAWIAARKSRWSSVVLSGVAFGIATLIRPSSLLAAPLVAFVLPLPRMETLARAAVVSVVAVATVLPWTYRNCRVMDGCALVSTNGGWNLAIGALTTTGRFTTLHAKDGCPIVTGQVQQDRCWAQVGVATIAKDPLRWLELIPKKLAQTYDHESFAIEYLHEADLPDWPESRRVAGRALLTMFHQMLLAVALLGVIALPSPRRLGVPGTVVQGVVLALVLAFVMFAAFGDDHPFWVLPAVLPILPLLGLPGTPRVGGIERFLLGWILATSVTHAVFFGDDRYHLVITPALAILAAAALRRMSARPTPVTA
jgi:4-amino-4-deoxy-L-arabinose transferase-like glycosyltransferase